MCALVSAPEFFGDKPEAEATEFFSRGPVAFAALRSQAVQAEAQRTASYYLDSLMIESVEELQAMSNDAHMSALRLCFKGDESALIPGQLKILLRYLGTDGKPHQPPAPAAATEEREAGLKGEPGQTQRPAWLNDSRGGEDNAQNFADCNKAGRVKKESLPLPADVKEAMLAKITGMIAQGGGPLNTMEARS